MTDGTVERLRARHLYERETSLRSHRGRG
jgi:hypothetical protein